MKPCKKALEKLNKIRKIDESRLCVEHGICPQCGGDLLKAGWFEKCCVCIICATTYTEIK